MQTANTRRDFIKYSLMSSLALYGLPALSRASKPPLGRVVIVGGGFAGATVAKYLRVWSAGNIETIVIEPNPQFVSCPMSNLVLGGSKRMDDLSFSYALTQKNHDIQWVQDTVTSIDPQRKAITMSRGELSYDKLIIAPGVDFSYTDLPALQNLEAQQRFPHAWKAGKQTVLLKQQIDSMPDGGVFVMTIPKAPYRCPPGPYERACQVAHYFKQHKPRNKVIVLDANPDIVSKKALFAKAFKDLYQDHLEYHNNSEILNLDLASHTIKTDFETIQGDVLNIIPPQLAGKVAQLAGLNNVDKKWCGVDFVTYESAVYQDIHVIGDSISAGLPKSAHMATSQAKICAAAIVDILAGQAPNPNPVFANTCYSYVDDKQAIHVANVYRYDANKKSMVAAEGGGVSVAPSNQEGEFAQAWAKNIWADVLT